MELFRHSYQLEQLNKIIKTDSAQAFWGERNYLTVEIMLFHTLTKMDDFGVSDAILLEGANSGQI